MIAVRITSFTVAPFWWARRMTGARSDRTVRNRRWVPVGRLSEHGVAWVRSDGPSSTTALVNRRSMTGSRRTDRTREPAASIARRTSEGAGRGKSATECGLRPVHEPTQNGKPGDAVGQDVVEHEDQRSPAVSQAGQQGGGPQRTVPRQPSRQLLDGIREHALVVGRSGAVNDREVLVELKARMVHPDRSTAPERHVDEPLTQPRNRVQPMLQHLRQPRSIEVVTDIEQ